MNYLRSRAIVLSRTNYQEADRIIDFLTPERGVIGAIARGVRREKSKLAGAIELFSVVDLTSVKTKGDLEVITGARLEKHYGHIVENYERLQFAYNVLKQIRKEAAPIVDPAFFELLNQTLQFLDDTEVELALVKTWFWLQLAILLGVGANLATDSEGKKLVEDTTYEYDIEHSAFREQSKGQFTSDHIKLLRLLSVHSPAVAEKVKRVNELISDCLWFSEHLVAH